MFMRNLEPIYNKINELLIEELPRQIDKINKARNDGIILEQFKNCSLEDNGEALPRYECIMHESEATQKDRIIEVTLLSLTLRIKLKPNTKHKMIHYFRYKEAIWRTFFDAETDLWDGFFDGPTHKDMIKLIWRIEH